MARKDTLYVTDMDGTLLGPDSRVDEESREILRELSEKGYCVTVATARTPATVSGLLAGCGMRVPAIVMTGAANWCASGGYSEVKYFDPGLYDSLDSFFRAHGLSPFVYTLPRGGEVMEVYRAPRVAMNHGEELFVEQRRGLKLKRFHLSREVPGEARNATVLFFAMGPLERVLRAAEAIETGYDCSVSAYPDIFLKDTGLLEVFSPGVSKASAVRSLARRLGKSRIVAFGDNLNDLPMLEAADVAVAVENALDSVKECADLVIGSNVSGAVAKYIRDEK